MTRDIIRPAVAAMAALAIAGLGAAPASAAPRDDARPAVCWLDADTGDQQCFADDAEFEAAVAEQTGRVVVHEDDMLAARGIDVVAAATYVIGEFYEGQYYLGVKYNITSSSSTVCASGSKKGNFGSGPNNTISSYRAYFGCSGRVYDLPNQAGDSSSLVVNAPTLGSMDNRASSYILT